MFCANCGGPVQVEATFRGRYGHPMAGSDGLASSASGAMPGVGGYTEPEPLLHDPEGMIVPEISRLRSRVNSCRW